MPGTVLGVEATAGTRNPAPGPYGANRLAGKMDIEQSQAMGFLIATPTLPILEKVTLRSPTDSASSLTSPIWKRESLGLGQLQPHPSPAPLCQPGRWQSGVHSACGFQELL